MQELWRSATATVTLRGLHEVAARVMNAASTSERQRILQASAAFCVSEAPKHVARVARRCDELEVVTGAMGGPDRLRENCATVCATLTAMPQAAENVFSALRAADTGLGQAVHACMGQLATRLEGARPAELHAIDLPLRRLWMDWLRARALMQQHVLVHESAREGGASEVRSIVDPDCALRELIEDARGAVEGLFVEKHGVVAPIVVKADAADMRVLCMPRLVSHIAIELLKNACAAMHRRHGIDVDQGPPVVVAVAGSAAEVGFSITAQDEGMSPLEREMAARFFFTTAPPREPTYTVSAGFGGSLQGQGVGLPLSQMYARLHRGDIALATLPGRSTHAFVTLSRTA